MSFPLIFIIAGEPSGDALGRRLMMALKKLTNGKVRFAGIGGEGMTTQGLKSLFPMYELSIIGLVEVLLHLPRLIQCINKAARAAISLRPDMVVTIDAPDFSFRVAKKLKGKGIPLVHYVAPTVWVWRPRRAKKIAAFLDHLIAFLPFEPPYFEKEGLSCSFVGHPVLESGAGKGDGMRFRRSRGLDEKTPLLCVLPGSRYSEVKQLLPIYGQTLQRLASKYTDLCVVVPTVPSVADIVRDSCMNWPLKVLIEEDFQVKYDAFAAATAALAASGTVALELAMAETPAIITYKMNPITVWLGRKLVKVPYVNLVNLLLKREAIPELLFDDCVPECLAPAIERLLMDPVARKMQQQDYAKALAQLDPGGKTPSEQAACIILDLIERRKEQ